MNGRVLLLVGMTACFMRIWTGGQPSARLLTSVGPAHAMTSEQGKGPVASRAPLARPSSEIRPIQEDEASPQEDSSIPLPEGISPGVFRVVDNYGGIFEVNLTEQELPDMDEGTEASQQDFYISDEGPRRYYFIRLNTDENEAPPDERLRVQRPTSVHPLVHGRADLAAEMAAWSRQIACPEAAGECQPGESISPPRVGELLPPGDSLRQ